MRALVGQKKRFRVSEKKTDCTKRSRRSYAEVFLDNADVVIEGARSLAGFVDRDFDYSLSLRLAEGFIEAASVRASCCFRGMKNSPAASADSSQDRIEPIFKILAR
jgi:hypothetical protein